MRRKQRHRLDSRFRGLCKAIMRIGEEAQASTSPITDGMTKRCLSAARCASRLQSSKISRRTRSEGASTFSSTLTYTETQGAPFCRSSSDHKSDRSPLRKALDTAKQQLVGARDGELRQSGLELPPSCRHRFSSSSSRHRFSSAAANDDVDDPSGGSRPTETSRQASLPARSPQRRCPYSQSEVSKAPARGEEVNRNSTAFDERHSKVRYHPDDGTSGRSDKQGKDMHTSAVWKLTNPGDHRTRRDRSKTTQYSVPKSDGITHAKTAHHQRETSFDPPRHDVVESACAAVECNECRREVVLPTPSRARKISFEAHADKKLRVVLNVGSTGDPTDGSNDNASAKININVIDRVDIDDSRRGSCCDKSVRVRRDGCRERGFTTESRSQAQSGTARRTCAREASGGVWKSCEGRQRDSEERLLHPHHDRDFIKMSTEEREPSCETYPREQSAPFHQEVNHKVDGMGSWAQPERPRGNEEERDEDLQWRSRGRGVWSTYAEPAARAASPGMRRPFTSIEVQERRPHAQPPLRPYHGLYARSLQANGIEPAIFQTPRSECCCRSGHHDSASRMTAAKEARRGRSTSPCSRQIDHSILRRDRRGGDYRLAEQSRAPVNGLPDRLEAGRALNSFNRRAEILGKVPPTPLRAKAAWMERPGDPEYRCDRWCAYERVRAQSQASYCLQTHHELVL